MDCKTCEKATEKNVSWAYVELLNDGHKSTISKLWIAIIILIVLLAVCNIVWIIAWNQYDYTTNDIEQDGRGINIIGDNNDTEQWYEPANTDKTENP